MYMHIYYFSFLGCIWFTNLLKAVTLGLYMSHTFYYRYSFADVVLSDFSAIRISEAESTT